MFLQEIIPHPRLAGFIRVYKIIRFSFPSGIQVPVKAYTPRPEHCIQFFPAGGNSIRYEGAADTITPPHAAIIGQHTVINHRQPSNHFFSVQVIFKPGALQRWLGMPSTALTNSVIDAEAILGKEIAIVNEQLYFAESQPALIAVLEDYLFSKLKNLQACHHAVSTVAELMLHQEDKTLDWFVQQACLSHRQFDRRFYESTGVGPKEYMKLIRFDKAFRMKNRYPQKDWLSIALHCGYHDYPHLSKTYKEFTGHSPAAFFAIDNQAPERALGEAET